MLPRAQPHRALGCPDLCVWSRPWKSHQCWRMGLELLFSKARPSCSDMSSSRPNPRRLGSRDRGRQECRQERPSPRRVAGQVGLEQHLGTGLSACCPQTGRYSSPQPLGPLLFLKATSAHNRHSVFERTQEGCTLPSPCCVAQALDQRKSSEGTCCPGGLQLPLSPALVSTLGPLPPPLPPVLRPALHHPRHFSTTSKTWASRTSLESGNPGPQLGRGH